MTEKKSAAVIGAGLAGSEAAWQLAKQGISVVLYEMKPKKMTPAHHSADFGELVCSNSLRAKDLSNSVGLLKEEMRRLGSLIVSCADQTEVEAGGALAVDRRAFSAMITENLRCHPNIQVVEQEVTEIPAGPVIIATGPLTTEAFFDVIARRLGQTELLHFYDAAAPIVTFESLDMENAFFASRYDKGTPDYINCPLTREEYDAFWTALCSAEEAPVHGFEDRHVFEGCMPVEVMGRRGRDTMRFGPLKPVGLRDPKTGREFYAVVQLRKDNASGTLYNMVGFQTHLKFGEQRRVFSMIPALKHGEFVRYGVMHRNTFFGFPRLLDRHYRLKQEPRIRFAGQMTGVEGYVESAASGLEAGFNLARELLGKECIDFPKTTAMGALGAYISNATVSKFQPMNINFGIMDSLDHPVKNKRERNLELSEQALQSLDTCIRERGEEKG